jgi:hypothetical protein
MGLFDFFTKPSKRDIESQVRKAKERYAQPDYRRMAMDKLLKWNSDESLSGLLERFTVMVQSPHWDEEEKRWLVEQFVALGDKMKPLLRRFIFEKNDVNYALEAYEKIVKNPAEFKELLVAALESRAPQDHRSVQGKKELIAALIELQDRSLDMVILPYIDDHSDDVQCIALHALALSPAPEVRERIKKLIESEDYSPRVLRSAAEIVAKQKLKLNNNIKLAAAVMEDFRIDNDLLVRLQKEDNNTDT